MRWSEGRTWIPELDFVRGFAITAVILIHITAYFGRSSVLVPIIAVNMIADAFLHFAVPLFILLSGLVLSRVYWANSNVIIFLRRRMRSILPPYAIFSILYILFSIIVLGWPFSPFDFLVKMLTGTAWAHLWFIPLILQLYLLHPLFVSVYAFFEKRGAIRWLLAITLAIQFSQSVVQVLTNSVVFGADPASQLIFNSFVGYIFYFFIGIYFGRNIQEVIDKIRRVSVVPMILLAVAAGAIPSLYLSTRYYGIPYGLSMNAAFLFWSAAIPVLTVAMFILFFRLSSHPTFSQSKYGQFMKNMGECAFGIYLVHPIFITIYEIIMTHIAGIAIQSASFYILLIFLTIASSIILVRMVAKLPFEDFIVGVRIRASSAGR